MTGNWCTYSGERPKRVECIDCGKRVPVAPNGGPLPWRCQRCRRAFKAAGTRKWAEGHPEQAQAHLDAWRQSHVTQEAARKQAQYAANRTRILRRARRKRVRAKVARSPMGNSAYRQRFGPHSARVYCERCELAFSNPDAWEVCHPSTKLGCLDPSARGLIKRRYPGAPEIWGFSPWQTRLEYRITPHQDGTLKDHHAR